MKKIGIIVSLIFLNVTLFSQDTVQQLLNEGVNQITRKNYRIAIEIFDKAISLDKGDQELYAHRGQAKHYLNMFKEAIEDYNKAIQIEPDYAEVYHLRGIAKAELKDMKGACEDWEKSYEKGERRVLELIIEFCKDYIDTK